MSDRDRNKIRKETWKKKSMGSVGAARGVGEGAQEGYEEDGLKNKNKMRRFNRISWHLRVMLRTDERTRINTVLHRT